LFNEDNYRHPVVFKIILVVCIDVLFMSSEYINLMLLLYFLLYRFIKTLKVKPLLLIIKQYVNFKT